MEEKEKLPEATFQGYVISSIDALVLFEACLTGALCHVPRHPYDHEIKDVVKSGNIFIFEQQASGIKCWFDGFPWAPIENEKDSGPHSRLNTAIQNRRAATVAGEPEDEERLPNPSSVQVRRLCALTMSVNLVFTIKTNTRNRKNPEAIFQLNHFLLRLRV